MEINEPQVKAVGGKVRRVGDDTDLFLERVAAKLTAGCQHNQTLASMATLKQVVDRLQGHTRGLANISQTLGDNLVTAASNHELNDIRKAGVFSALSPAGGEAARN